MIFLMAFRNIVRNKRNSIVLILLVGVITLLFFLGNSVLGRAEYGLKKTFVESLTGDVVIQKNNDVTLNLFGANVPIIDSYAVLPTLPAYDEIYKIAAQMPAVEKITGQVSCNAAVRILEQQKPALIAGIDADSYFDLFGGIQVEDGRRLKSGESGGMITRARADRIFESTGKHPAIGDPLLFTTAGVMGFRIREVPLVGIYSYESPGQFMDEIVLIDVQTARALASIQVASFDVTIPESAVNLIETNMDDLFSFDSDDDADADKTDFLSEFPAGAFSDEAFSEFDLSGENLELGSGSVIVDTNATSGGDWNFMILRLNDNAPLNASIRRLNAALKPFGARAVGWRLAAGNSAILVILVQLLFNAGVALVSIAGIIAVINILLISVFRRTREIGTLRAIGTSDGYIRSFIFIENGVLSLVAGIVGIAAGAVVISVINKAAIGIPNDLIASLLGGAVLNIQFDAGIAFLSVLVAAGLGFFASIYPVEMAVRIEPITAVRQG